MRLQELCHLKVSDIDSDRMTLRVEQGKGAKGRYTLLSPRLLMELRRYWCVYRPQRWLFPSPRDPEQPLSKHTAHRIYHAAKDRAGITKEFGGNPRWLGGQIGVSAVLHTWGQTLSQHLHVHCLVTGGALGSDGRWFDPRRGFLFPVKALSTVFRGKFLAALKRAFASGALSLAGSTSALAGAGKRAGLFADLYAQPWVGYAKRPFAGPEQVLAYLGRYTHRIALTNNRLLSFDDHAVRFRYKDYAAGGRRKVMTLDAQEFIRRYLLHVLPTGFTRIRHYGLNANRAKRHRLAQARAALNAPPAPVPTVESETVAAFWLRVAHRDIHHCPNCASGRLLRIATLLPHAHGPPQ